MAQLETRGKSIIGKGAVTFVADTTSTINPTGLADGAGETVTVAIADAALGDTVLVGPGNDLQGITFSAWVNAAGTVSIRLQNESGGSLDIASSTWNIKVLR